MPHKDDGLRMDNLHALLDLFDVLGHGLCSPSRSIHPTHKDNL
jgi:hypothetical protein